MNGRFVYKKNRGKFWKIRSNLTSGARGIGQWNRDCFEQITPVVGVVRSYPFRRPAAPLDRYISFLFNFPGAVIFVLQSVAAARDNDVDNVRGAKHKGLIRHRRIIVLRGCRNGRGWVGAPVCVFLTSFFFTKKKEISLRWNIIPSENNNTGCKERRVVALSREERNNY